MKIFVKPGGPDRKVPIPGSRPTRFVPAQGMLLERDTYVERRLRDGDLVEAEPATDAATPAATVANTGTVAPIAASPTIAASTTIAAAVASSGTVAALVTNAGTTTPAAKE